MKKIILITFGFMGWAWYEMSGGAAFEPGQHSVALLATYQPEPVETSPLPGAEPTETTVTRADTTAEPLTRVASQPERRIRIIDPTPLSVEQDKVAQVAAITRDLQTDSTKNTIVLSGLSGNLSDLGKPLGVTNRPASSVDYRVVTGSRVNLRGGPSTSYSVVTQLRRGNEVEVLQDDGAGWVKLRALDGNEIGWMSADFLVSSN